MKRCHIMVNNRPWCEIAETTWGNTIALKVKVYQCSYRTQQEAISAAKRLRKEFPRNCVKVIEGTCPRTY